MLDPKTSNMFYFTGKKHTAPNCPVELAPNFNPSAGVPSYFGSDRACSRNAKYFIPFFLERPGPRYMQWSVNAHEARPGHHTQVSSCSAQRRNNLMPLECQELNGFVVYSAILEIPLKIELGRNERFIAILGRVLTTQRSSVQLANLLPLVQGQNAEDGVPDDGHSILPNSNTPCRFMQLYAQVLRQ